MALVPLFDEVNQFNDYNGTVLAAGKLYVYNLGRTRLADIYSDLDGTVLQNPVTLDNLGRGPIYVSQDFNYTLVVTDEYGQEMFSQDKFIYSQGGPHNSANVAVGASEYIAVSSTQIGDTTVYTPYLTGDIPGPGSGGKTYHGIDPIVVNNIEDKISANTVPFGVQEPLYFVEDETATIIGLSGNPSADAVNWVTAQGYLRSPDLIGYATTDFVEEEVSGKYDTSAFSTISGAFLTAVPEGSMNESAFSYSGGLITAYNGSAFKAGDEFPQSATDAIQVVTSNSGNWDDSYSAVTSNSAVWDTVTGKLDATASGDFQTTAGMTGYATKDDISGLQSASVWNDAVNTVSSNSASWTGIEYTGVSPIVVDNTARSISADTWTVTFGSGLSAIDDTANSATTVVVTAQGGGDFVPLSANSQTVPINLGGQNGIWEITTYGPNKINIGAGYFGAYINAQNRAGHPSYNWSIGSTQVSGGGGFGNSWLLNGTVVSGYNWQFGTAEYNRLVPSSTTADENKVLTVNAAGTPEWQTAGGAATLPVSGSAGDNSAVYGLYDMKIECNTPSIGGSEPEHTYVQVGTNLISVYESYDGDQSNNQLTIAPGYIEFYNSVDGYVSFGGTDVLNWTGTYETVSNNSASWGSTITVATGSI